MFSMKNTVELRLIGQSCWDSANIAVMITLVLSVQFKPSNVTGSALEVHNAISTLAIYSPAFVVGSLTAYLVSQTFDVWFFNWLKQKQMVLSCG